MRWGEFSGAGREPGRLGPVSSGVGKPQVSCIPGTLSSPQMNHPLCVALGLIRDAVVAGFSKRNVICGTADSNAQRGQAGITNAGGRPTGSQGGLHAAYTPTLPHPTPKGPSVTHQPTGAVYGWNSSWKPGKDDVSLNVLKFKNHCGSQTQHLQGLDRVRENGRKHENAKKTTRLPKPPEPTFWCLDQAVHKIFCPGFLFCVGVFTSVQHKHSATPFTPLP